MIVPGCTALTLTDLLLPLLRQDAASASHARIVNVSTLGNSDDAEVPNESSIGKICKLAKDIA